jgi:hypothetical protein
MRKILGVNANDADIVEPNVLPPLHLFTCRQRLWRDRLFRTETRSAIDNLRVHGGVKPSVAATVESADQYPAIAAKQAIRGAASLAILSALALVFDSNEE